MLFLTAALKNTGSSIYAAGSLRLTDCTFGRDISGINGQLFCSSATTEIIGYSFSRGHASKCGGGLNSGRDISVFGCTIIDCSAEYYGGGIWSIRVAKTKTQQCIICGNFAGTAGADICAARVSRYLMLWRARPA